MLSIPKSNLLKKVKKEIHDYATTGYGTDNATAAVKDSEVIIWDIMTVLQGNGLKIQMYIL
jgi:hypothetical protein